MLNDLGSTLLVDPVTNNLERLFCLFALMLTTSCSTVVTAEPPQLETFGWIEPITVHPADILLHAKLDTGADNCSVHAEYMERFKKDGATWVRFTISNRFGEHKILESRIIRTAKVKTKRGTGTQRRPVVRLGMCLGAIYETVECNLVDRSHFEYPVLIGRNFLAGTALVNSSETYTSAPNCDIPQESSPKN